MSPSRATPRTASARLHGPGGRGARRPGLGHAHIPVAFVLLSGLAFFAWGEIYSLFPAVCADAFGKQYATTNYARLYTAKGTAALLVPLGTQLREATGSWVPVFAVVIAFDWITALLALFVLPRLLPARDGGASQRD